MRLLSKPFIGRETGVVGSWWSDRPSWTTGSGVYLYAKETRGVSRVRGELKSVASAVQD